jgi:hypothetical protein
VAASLPRKRRFGRSLRLAIAGALAVAGAWLLIADARLGHSRSPAEHARALFAAHGIVVGLGSPSSFFVPPYTPGDANLAHVQAQRIEPESAAIALDGIERALTQYPADFVAKLIKAIFVAGELRVGGVKAAGTIGPAWIIIAAPRRLGTEGIFENGYLGVHHELSSFVLHRNPDRLTEWAHFAPETWHFDDMPEAIRERGTGPDPDPSTGFLSAYGATNPENDFNVYAEKIFTEPGSLSQLARRLPIIRKKLDYVIAAYVDIDPRMIEVFGDLGLI